MLIVDLLNILCDQSDYGTLVMLASLHKRQTAYANKYSLLRYYVNGCVNNVGTICVNGSIKMLKHVANDIDINAGIYYESYTYRLWWNSITNGHLEIAKYVVMVLGGNVDDYNSYVLQLGAGFGRLDMVKYLTSMVTNADDLLQHALSFSASGNHLETMKYLIKHSISVGANVKKIVNRALKWCANVGHSTIIKVRRGDGIQSHEGPAIRFGENYCDLKAIEYLVSIGADVHYDGDEYVLRQSVGLGRWHMVKYFVSIGADVHSNNEYALRMAVRSGDLEIVKFLINAGADIHVNNDELFDIQLIKDHFGYLLHT